MAENYVDKLKIGGVDRPIQDTTSGFYTKPGTGIPSTDLAEAVQTSLGKADGAIPSTEKGANSGVATLDANGKIPSSQLPGSVDEIIEAYYKSADGKFYEHYSEGTYTDEITGEASKIYVDLLTEKTYRWGGSAYVEISASIALGETNGTAYEGSKGKALKDKLDTVETNADVTDSENVKAALNVVTTSAGKYLKDDGTWDIPVGTTYSEATTSAAGLMGSSDKTKLNGIEDNADVTDADNVKSALGTDSTHGGAFLRKDGTWQTPPNDNTTYGLSVGTGADSDKIVLTPSSGSADTITVPYATTAGSAPASDVSAWAKAANKPSYAYSEIGYTVGTQTTSGAVTVDGTTPLHIITLSGAATSLAFSTGNLPPVGHSCHVIFTASSATTVTLAHIDTGSVRYICPAGDDPDDLDVPAGGYIEVDLLRAPDTTESNDTISWIYVRGI